MPRQRKNMDAEILEELRRLNQQSLGLATELKELKASFDAMDERSKTSARELGREIDRLRMEMEADNAFSSAATPRQLRLRSSGSSILGSGTRGQNQTSYRLFED